MAKLIIPQADHFSGRVSWKGSLDKISSKFSEMNLMDRVRETQFKYIFSAPPLLFSGTIIHEMLLRKSGSNKNGIQFLVNKTELNFGIREFALITGLHFGKFPVKTEMGVTSLLKKYFKSRKQVKIGEVESCLVSCANKEDVWKLGLVCLVSQYLFAYEPKRNVDMKLFDMVEDPDFFLQYPWGKICFRITLKGINKNMPHYRQMYIRKKKKYDEYRGGRRRSGKVYPPDAQYTVYGFALAFQVWTYEVITSFVPSFAERLKLEEPGPRIMLYTSNKKNSRVEISKALNDNVRI